MMNSWIRKISIRLLHIKKPSYGQNQVRQIRALPTTTTTTTTAIDTAAGTATIVDY